MRLSSACIINPKNHIDDNTHVSFIPMSLIHDGYSNQFETEQRKWIEVKKGFTHFAENDVCFAKITHIIIKLVLIDAQLILIH